MPCVSAAVHARGGKELRGHLARFGRFLARRERREREDSLSLAALARSPLPLPTASSCDWLGVAGYRLSYEGQALYIDPYVSRVPFRAVLSGSRWSRTWLCTTACSATSTPTSSGSSPVTPTSTTRSTSRHSRRRWHTRAYGSSSLRALMSLYGLAEAAVEVVPQQEFELGPFAVTFFPSLHSKLLLGYRVPADGELSCEHLDGLTPSAYRCGDIYGSGSVSPARPSTTRAAPT